MNTSFKPSKKWMIIIKIIIDQNLCVGCGTCTFICVEAFELDRTGEKAQITPEFRLEKKYIGEVPKNLKCVNVAEKKCPVFAIKTKEK